MEQMQNYLERLSVLVIEDNQGDFILIEDYLLEKFKNVEIVHCPDYATSVDFLAKSKDRISVVLLDLNLPDLVGVELIRSIIAHNVKVPIIVLTGYSDLAMAKSSLQIGVYDYLVKDEISPTILQKTIIYALHRSRFINQIEDEKRKFENLFNFSPQPTWLLDSQSLRILQANIAAQNTYGFSLDEFLQMSFTHLHPKGQGERIEQKFTSNDGQISGDHFTHVLRSGKEITVDIYFREIDETTMSGLIVQVNDVSEVVKHINTIEVQNTQLRNIAWTQSHVVRAPLSRMLGIVNLIELKAGSFDELLFCLQQLRISSIELNDIIVGIVEESNHIEHE